MLKNSTKILSSAVIAGCLTCTQTTFATDDAAELAKKLSNPVADIINMPFQLNYDNNIGTDKNTERYQLNIQPVIPIKLNDDWNVISRTVLPVIVQQYDGMDKSTDWGVGDITQSFFFTPTPKSPDDLIIGFGPVIYLPTASEKVFGPDQYALGPTAVIAKQSHGWTVGALANHLWAVEKKEGAEGINSTFLQPFVNYTTPTSVTYSLNTESTYDWNTDDYTIPVNLTATKIVKIDKQLISIGGGFRYWIHDTDSSAKDFGVRLIASFIFPK
ncbi:transporter [Acinetobacter sp. MYb177]|uniref:transporter n=1 Tax=unclassified Acinetobacter TaxID=196816 RepID=UPI000FB3D3DC